MVHRISAFNYQTMAEIKSIKNQSKLIIEAVDEIKKNIKDNETLTFWILKMTMKMYSVFNNCPIRQVKYADT